MTESDERVYELHRDEMNRRSNWDDQIKQSELGAAIEREEMNLFSLLKPTVSIDGNQYCVLYGENIQEGICGFGNTIMEAIRSFNKEWNKGIKNE